MLITSKQTFHYAISIPNGQQVVASRLSFMIMFILCEPLLHCIIVATFLSFHIVRGDDEDDSRLQKRRFPFLSGQVSVFGPF